MDNSIYPREKIDHNRVTVFADNLRDSFTFDPIEIQSHPAITGKYRILDGVHRWSAYKEVGQTEPEVIIRSLNGADPLLYSAKRAIGPRQLPELPEEETKNTARRAYQNNPGLTSIEMGKAIGRSRRTVDSYIADLRAAIHLELDLKIFRMNRLGIPQERITKRLGIPRTTLSDHLPNLARLPNPENSDLSRGFTVPHVA